MTRKHLDSCVDTFRHFNRFHTRLVGTFNEEILESGFPLVQARLLYELANGENIAAADLMKSLKLDRGYLSRMVSALEDKGLLYKTPDPSNAKRMVLRLSETGRRTFNQLDKASAKEAARLLEGLSTAEQKQLTRSMVQIERLLDGNTRSEEFKLREPKPGDMGWITHRHGVLYWEEYQWDWTFEALVGEIVSDFVKNNDPKSDRCWIAERDGDSVGSIFVVRQDDETAKLRLLYVEPSARGLGIGQCLINECIKFAQEKEYKRLALWTNSILGAARTLYERSGFELVEEEPHHSFGHDLIGQTWSLKL